MSSALFINIYDFVIRCLSCFFPEVHVTQVLLFFLFRCQFSRWCPAWERMRGMPESQPAPGYDTCRSHTIPRNIILRFIDFHLFIFQSNGSVNVHIDMDQPVQSEPRLRLVLAENLLRDINDVIHRMEVRAQASNYSTSKTKSAFYQ